MEIMKFKENSEEVKKNESEIQPYDVDRIGMVAEEVARVFINNNGPIEPIVYDQEDALKTSQHWSKDITQMQESIHKSGLKVFDDGLIGSDGDGSIGGFMPGIAFYRNDHPTEDDKDYQEFYYNTVVANTVDGFRVVGSDSNKNLIDCGPLTTPFVTGVNRPEALIIPLNNMQALENGVEFIHSYAEKAAELSKDIMKLRFENFKKEHE